jgi:hypothetical protein
VTAVHVANALDHEPAAIATSCPCAQLDLDYLAKLNLTDRLSYWRAQSRSLFRESAA